MEQCNKRFCDVYKPEDGYHYLHKESGVGVTEERDMAQKMSKGKGKQMYDREDVDSTTIREHLKGIRAKNM